MIQPDASKPPERTIPLYVDLDGTLVSIDVFVAGLKTMLRRNPLTLFVLPFMLSGGRPGIKRHVARRVPVDAAALPYRRDVLSFLQEERAAGRTIVLATAAHRVVADAVAAHLRLFDDILATDTGRNLKGEAKLRAIRAHAAGDFAYMGDSSADIPILRAAAEGYLVHPSPRLRAAVDTMRIARVFA